MKNNKGFTLIELIATIVILAVVLSITGYAITGIISSARQKNYELLITDIKSAAELYYQECTYMSTASLNKHVCNDGTVRNITLGELVIYGYLTSNDSTESENSMRVINPNTEEDISDCQIKITYEDELDEIKIESVNKSEKCPEAY